MRDGEDYSSIAVVDADPKMASSPRRRKKVVTFASMAQLAEIQALATCETDSQSSEIGKPACAKEANSQPLQEPGLFLNMPLEDFDATGGHVSRSYVTKTKLDKEREMIKFLNSVMM